MRHVIHAFTQSCLLVTALYGAYSFYQSYCGGSTITDCPSRFEVGIMKIGPHIKVNPTEAWQLICLAKRCHDGRWKLYEFAAKNKTPVHFVVVWDGSGKSLIAFELNEFAVERVHGDPPADYRSVPSDLVAAR